MNTRLSIIIQSHLSDSQIEMGIESLKNRAETRINFVKFLVMKYSDLDQEIDPDADWDEFVRKHPALVTL